jgi:hypothetical protein
MIRLGDDRKIANQDRAVLWPKPCGFSENKADVPHFLHQASGLRTTKRCHCITKQLMCSRRQLVLGGA